MIKSLGPNTTLFLGMISVIIFCFANPGWSAPAYGTRMPEKGKLAAGLQTYIVSERDLADPNDAMHSRQEFVLLSYGVLDWLSLDLKGGVGNIYESRLSADDITYPTFLGGGYGFRVKFFDDGKTRAVAGFQHISIHPYSVSVDNGKKTKAVLDDWQFSALISHDIGKLTPYAGFKLSRMDEIRWVDTERNRIKSEYGVGVIAGTDIVLTKRVWLNLETQWVDSVAYAASVNYKF
ncbi:MAG: hypothetical protein HQL23_03625 [Candidatus Omnitrophica bacterium]|nr:hypothetical protein [Candidatus Omnitrophota bacterium]